MFLFFFLPFVICLQVELHLIHKVAARLTVFVTERVTWRWSPTRGALDERALTRRPVRISSEM